MKLLYKMASPEDVPVEPTFCHSKWMDRLLKFVGFGYFEILYTSEGILSKAFQSSFSVSVEK